MGEEIKNLTQYLTFLLRNEVFSIEISKVREVLEFKSVTRVPHTPDFMEGVINLRGSVVPVVDLGLKFGMDQAKKTVNACIIIVEVLIENESVILGALVDSVQEVIDLENSQIEPPPKMGTTINVDFLKGIGKKGDNFIILLDVDQVFQADELTIIGSSNAFAK
ncbi:MAG: purine-binding chemotaxis protein CheW [bacterium]|jgi:purine-binding chemotaxis protein CheW